MSEGGCGWLLYKGLPRRLSDHVPCHKLFVPGARATVHCIALILLVLSFLASRGPTIKRLWERKRQVTSLATLHRIRIIHVRGHRYIEVLSAAEAVRRCVKDDDLWIGIRRQCNSVSLYLLRWLQHRGVCTVCPNVVRLADSVPDRTRSQHFRGRSIVH